MCHAAGFSVGATWVNGSPKANILSVIPEEAEGMAVPNAAVPGAEQGRTVWGTAALPMMQGSAFMPGEVCVSRWDTDTTVLNSVHSARELLRLNWWEILR